MSGSKVVAVWILAALFFLTIGCCRCDTHSQPQPKPKEREIDPFMFLG
jgi:hypothetical protein